LETIKKLKKKIKYKFVPNPQILERICFATEIIHSVDDDQAAG
jgi:hypothetical protein